MAYFKVNCSEELKKAAQGEKTKIPVGMVLYGALRNYPHIQQKIADAFGITEDV